MSDNDVWTQIGYMAGLQHAINYLDEVIASGELSDEEERLLEQIIEDLQSE